MCRSFNTYPQGEDNCRQGPFASEIEYLQSTSQNGYTMTEISRELHEKGKKHDSDSLGKRAFIP